MATYILIHGSWHQSWCWKKVTPLLEANGHTVLTPDLKGHTKETGISYKDLTLNDYVGSIIELIKSLSGEIILVGHSMAGMIISQVAELMPEKIDQLIFLSSYVPSDGENLTGITQKITSSSPGLNITYNQNDFTVSIDPNQLKTHFYNDCSPEDIAFAQAGIVNEPVGPFLTTVSLSNDRFGSIKKIYIECLNDKAISIETQRVMQSKIECVSISLDSSHSPFFSIPDQLVHAILNPTPRLSLQ